ncbi:MAG: pyrroline-5-carboxylate reductase [Tepidanaerobacteraceae bacterium]|jgi:pyrroline-5-carboxylate reductase|nr:pyrroline-5-carboxylate reductase [Tepidanaerobacteraceae bacterium]
MEASLGIIGAGAMAEALLAGVLSCGLLYPENVYVINRKNDERLKFLKETYGVNVTRQYSEVFSCCDNIIIAVKPKDMADLIGKIREFVSEKHIIISVAAGISTSFIESRLEKKIRVVRAMPNTSCQVKASATAIAQGAYSDEHSISVARELFSSVGKVVIVDEKALDAVTGLSGSGPAYVYLMLEALTEAGISAGLAKEISEQLAVQTVFGAAKMALESGEAPVHLRRKVTSPGGTTMAGIKTLQQMGFTASIVEAVRNAAERSRQLLMENCK